MTRTQAKSTRRIMLLALGVAVPVLMLATGWFFASARDRDSRLAARRASLSRTLETARDAVAVGLEAMRTREDERPFYLYNYYYSPPEVLSISDPIAISALATFSDDPRVLGHFQIDPDGTVRTPLSTQVREPQSERESRVVAAARSDALTDLREIVATRASLVASVRTDAPPEEQQVTVTLNQWDNALATEIQAAQAGDTEAFGRVVRRGRAAPITTRRSVGLTALEATVDDAQDSRVPTRRRSRAVPTAPPVEPDAAADSASAVDRRMSRQIEVDYSPMQWRAGDGVLVLARVVSHEGAAVVQGVAFDSLALRAWIERAIASADPDGLVEVRDDAAGCLLHAQHEAFPPRTALCVEVGALDGVRAELDHEIAIEGFALLVLLVFVGLALLAIHRAAQREEALARQRSEFVTAVSHELRTPLTTLRMHAEMLAEGLVPPEREKRVYSELASETARLSRLVENVLEVSRLEAGKRPLRRARIDLRARVRELAHVHEPLALARGGAMHPPVEGPPVEIEVDTDALERIVVNLVDNAVKYGASGGAAELFVDAEPGFAVLSVCDRGEGIAPAEAERVFERFVRVARDRDAHQPGTGLGLALVRELARAHGGDAEVRTRAGGGAEVRVKFPLSEPTTPTPR